MLVHASCVALDDHAVLLRGPSGSGKSDLALRLIGEGAVLVADDQVYLQVLKAGTGNDTLVARAPPALFGMLEVRGIGVERFVAIDSAPVRVAFDLDAHAVVERIPDHETNSLLGVELPHFTLNPFEASAPAKVKVGLRSCLDRCLRPGD